MIVTYIVVSVVILVFCALGLSIGLLVKGKPLQSCGNAVRDRDGNPITCPACGGKGECKKEVKD